jgi:hypothetical protein
MPSIAVVGNCQAPPIADVLTRIVSGASVTTFPLSEIHDDAARERAAESLQHFDFVFMQPLSQPKHGPLRAAEIQAGNSNVVLYPEIIFKGFHPDFIGTSGGGKVHSAAMEYHSCLVAAAFVRGIPVEQVGSLFNAFNFAKLGYFQEYDAGKEFLLSRAAVVGYDLAPALREWEKEEIFMHTPNHPKLHVLISVAAKAAEKASLRPDIHAADGMPDRLSRKVCLPVYPAIAKRLRLSGTLEFGVGEQKARRTFALEKYVTETYELYASAPKSFFEQKPIQRAAAILN